MSCVDFRIIDSNYLFNSSVGIDASSENSEFLAVNLRKYFRSKIWRTSGHFEITSSNNKIDFLDVSLGAQLTATLTVGHYTPSSLSTHIKAQMESVSAFTYTVSYSSTTGKWTIQTSGGFLTLLFGTGTNTATGTWQAIGFSQEDYDLAISYTGPKIAIHTDETLTVDLRSAEEIDSFALIFDPVLENVFSNEAVFRIQANATLNWTSPAVNVVLSLDSNNELATQFWATPLEYRYWRFQVVDPKNPNLYIDIHKIFLGKKLELKVPEIGFGINYEDKSSKIETMFGHEYVDVLPIRKSLQFKFRLLTNDQSEVIWNSFARVGQNVPVFCVIDSQEELFDKDRVSIYGKYAKNLALGHVIMDRFDHGLSIEEAF